MKKSKLVYSVLSFCAAILLTVGAMTSGTASASSHREAPLVSGDPQVDTTDVYAFVSPDISNTVTLIANWIPLQQPAAGPNFYKFADDALYEINVDNTGDARAHITYQFRFRSEVLNPNTFLYNTGVVTHISDATLNVRQFYSVTRITRGYVNGNFERTAVDVLANNVPVAPANIGPRSTPDYPTLAAEAIRPLANGGGQVFAGPRDDPFFVDLGSAFDLLGLRPLNTAHIIPLPTAPGVDGVAGYNVHTTALQIPKSTLGSSNGVIGVWAESKRPGTRVLQWDGSQQTSGNFTQVSRLAMPLVNEVVIPLAAKDRWNASRPDMDAQFGSYVTSPEPVGLINYLYQNAIPQAQRAPTSGRTDLVAVFLTGVQGLNQLPTVTPSEMIRLNTTIAPSANPNRLGVTAGDFAGFPNGRRLADDVVDVELRALECSYGVVGTVGPCDSATYNRAPNNALTDGVDTNDKPFLAAFPYMAQPFQGYEAVPPTGANMQTGLGVLGAAAGLGIALVYRRKRQKSQALAASNFEV